MELTNAERVNAEKVCHFDNKLKSDVLHVRNTIQRRWCILALLRSDPPDIDIPSKGHESARKFACFANR
jgi:hypothetical protein